MRDAVGDASTSVDPPASALWRAARAPVAVAAVVVLVAVGVVLLANRVPRGELDPAAADDAGSRALAALLADRGVELRRVRSVSAAVTAADADTTTVVVHVDRLPRAQLARLAPVAGPLVLVAPTEAALAALAPAVRVAGRAPLRTRDPRCPLPVARVAGDVELGGGTFAVDEERGIGCYPAGGAPTLVRTTAGQRPVTVLGDGAPLTNGQLANRGNAALALGLLAATPRLVWVLPDTAPPLADDEQGRDPFALLPAGVPWALLQLGVAVVLVALWRARRLGPVVAEPLPVVVRSAEATEGRARLYAAAGARDRAAAALRSGTESRLVAALGLPRDASPAAVVDAAAARGERPREAVHDLLHGPPPPDDPALVRLADALDALTQDVLTQEVRR